MGQPIQGPIKRRFFSSCGCRVYFLRKSTTIYDMRTEYQKMNTSFSFLSVLLIYQKSTAIYWLLSPPDWLPISPWSAEAFLSKFFLASETEILNLPSNIAFPHPVPSSLNGHSKIFSNEYSSGWHLITNPLNVLPPLRSEEKTPHLHTTSQSKNGLNYQSNLGLISADDPPDHHYKTLPKCFNQVNKLLKMEVYQPFHGIFIKHSHGAFGKIRIRKFIYVIFHTFYHSLFACLAHILNGNITSHSLNQPTLIFGEALSSRETNDRMFLANKYQIGVKILFLSSTYLI